MKEFNKNDLSQIFDEVITEYQERIRENVVVDEKTKETVFDIVIKISKLKNNSTTTIAKLIDYNPENSVVNPLEQGTIASYVKLLCKKLDIQLIPDNSIGGLAFNNKYKVQF